MPNEPEPASTHLPTSGLPADTTNPAKQAPAGGAAAATIAAAPASEQGAKGRGRSRYDYREVTTGKIPKTLLNLAWPQIAEGVLNVVDQLVDLVWAGRLPGGFRAVASVGVAQSFTQFSMMARQGLDQSMRAMIARAVGARNIPLANHIALQAFTLSGIYSLFMLLIGLFLTDVLLNAIGASAEVKSQTSMYMRVQFIGSAAIAFRMMSAAALQAAGEVMVPLKATTVTRSIHIVLTPFLMFGWWGFPALGLPGAALANILAQLAGSAINFYALFRGNSSLHLTFRGYRVDYSILWRIITLGAPACVAGTERATAQLVLLGLVTPFGDVALAAYALTRRMEMVASFGAMGMGQAAGIMAGQNLGARQPDRARQSVGLALVYITVLQVAVGSLFMLFPMVFVVLFTSDANVVALASVWLRIQVLAAIFMGLAMVFQQSYNIAGDTLAPMIITLLAVWGIELPVAWLLSRTGLGPLGIGYAAIAGMSARLLFYFPYFFWGRWLRVKVF